LQSRAEADVLGYSGPYSAYSGSSIIGIPA
jgi:hypothetical protein